MKNFQQAFLKPVFGKKDSQDVSFCINDTEYTYSQLYDLTLSRNVLKIILGYTLQMISERMLQYLHFGRVARRMSLLIRISPKTDMKRWLAA